MRQLKLCVLFVTFFFTQACASFPRQDLNQQNLPNEWKWEPERRLTTDPGDSQITFNFAHSVAVDDLGPVHVVWYDHRQDQSQVFYVNSQDGGDTWGQEVQLSAPGATSLHPSIAVSDYHILAVWQEMDQGQGIAIKMRRSLDGGENWEEEVELTESGGAAHASLAITGPVVHLVWGDTRSGEAEVYYRRSVDLGETWATEIRLTDLPFNSWTPSLAADGELVVLAWVDTRDGNEEEYVKVSSDAGLTWGPDIRLTTDRMNSWAPSVAVLGESIHLVWFDQKANPYHALDAEVKLDEALHHLGIDVPQAPSGVVVTNPEAAAKWRATQKLQRIQSEIPEFVARGGDQQILGDLMGEFKALAEGVEAGSYLDKEKKLDEVLQFMGISFESGSLPEELPKLFYGEALKLRVQDKMKQLQEALPGWVAGGGDPQQIEPFFRTFEKIMQSATAEWDIYYRRSDDHGATWGQEMRLTEAAGVSSRPNIAVDGDILHVVWFDNRDGNMEVYAKSSFDNGQTWTLDTRLTESQGASQHPMVALSGDTTHVVWFDQKDGNPEIYYRRGVRE